MAGSLTFLRLIFISGLLYEFIGSKIQFKMFNFFQHHEAPSFWVSWKEQSSNLDKRSEWAVRAGRTWGPSFKREAKFITVNFSFVAAFWPDKFASLGNSTGAYPGRRFPPGVFWSFKGPEKKENLVFRTPSHSRLRGQDTKHVSLGVSVHFIFK